jgi:uncharacterized protein YbbK (DUF523 family)
MPVQTKTFDAVEMSRRLREQTSRKLAGLSRDERLTLLNRHVQKSCQEMQVDVALLREEPPACGVGQR